jgi:hypothetical protein
VPLQAQTGGKGTYDLGEDIEGDGDCWESDNNR